MKKLTLSACIMAFSCFLSAQSLVQVKPQNTGVQRLVEKNINRQPLQEVSNLFKTNNDFSLKSKNLPVELVNEQVLTINSTVLSELYSNPKESVKLSLPYKGETLELLLIKQEILAPGFKVATNLNDFYPVLTGVHYRGVVNGEQGSLAAVSVFGDRVTGLIATDNGNLNLGEISNPNGLKSLENQYILYNDKELGDKVASDFCGTVDDVYNEKLIKAKPVAGYKSSANCVNIYFEVDYSVTQSKGGVTGAANYMEAVFNQVAILYQNEQINTKISEMFVWESNDPYGSNINTVLSAFRSNKNSNGYNGDLAHYVSLSVSGGLAYVDVLCSSTYGYGVSQLHNTYQNVPTYSWTVEVVTHELGHNLGSPHTQSCSWPGGAIDNCYTTEGGCPKGPQPTNGGTIMSYCHLTSTGINFNNGFGTLPGNLIRDRVYNSNCLSACDVGGNVCSTPLNVNASDIGQTNITVEWDAVSTALNYSFRYRAQGGSWYTSTETGTSKSLTGLNPLTAYEVQVRSNCDGENSDWSATETYTTLSDQPTYCSSRGNNSSYEYIQAVSVGTFTNTSGDNGGYQDFTTSVINITKGEATSFQLTPGFSSSAYNETWKLFADLNKDGDFNDAGETLFTSGNVQTIVSGSITIPASALVGNTRLRVSMKYNAAQTACETFTYGEVEDYTLNIQDAVAAPCNAPTGLLAHTPTTSSISLSWNAVSNATSYLVQHRVSGGSWSTQTVSGTSATVSGLSDNTAYDFRVASDCGNENSAYSNTVTQSTEEEQEPSCNAPENLIASSVTTNSFTVSWDAVSGATAYVVEVRLPGGSWSAFAASSNSLSLSGASEGTTYEVRVKADCGSLTSLYSSVISVTTEEEAEVCDAPINVQASNVGETAFDISWNTVANAVSYVVEYTPVGGSWTALTSSTNSISITGLVASTAYQVRVQTACSSMSSAKSAIVTVTTDDAPNANYCEAKGTSSSREWIRSITVGNFSKTSNNNGGYADFTGDVINLEPGANIVASFTPGFTGFWIFVNSYPEMWRMWIDYNKDGDFDDAGELVLGSTATTTGSISGSFQVPAGLSGTTRLRIAMRRDNAASSCGTFAYGEVEDYTVAFVGNAIETGTEEKERSLALGLLPNPTSGAFTVNASIAPEHGASTISVYDITGRVIKTAQIAASQTEASQQIGLDIGTSAAGTYLVVLETANGEKLVERIVKQ